jgi:F5/8 type C domain
MNESPTKEAVAKPKRTLHRAAYISALLFASLASVGCSSGESQPENESLGESQQLLTTRYEAESATSSGYTLAANASASAGQYLDGNPGCVVTWTVSSTGGSQTLAFATKNPSGAGRKLGTFVNGTKVGVITTDNGTLPFTTKSLVATLANGNNSIQLQDSEGTTEPDVDYLEVTSAACTPSCTGKTCGSDGCGGICGVCGMGQNCGAAQTCVAGTAAYYNTGKTLDPTPDFGANVKVFTPADSASTVQTYIDGVYTAQHTNQFGSRRDAILFTPGTYGAHVPVGFNTQVAGLGDHPDAVVLTGFIEAPPDFLPNNNGTQTFWRMIENFKSYKPTKSSSGSAAGAFDNNATTTRWESAVADPQWMQIDLGVSRFINRVRLDWETANAKDYTVQISSDGTNFTTIASKTAMAAGNHRIDDLTGLSGSGRYVRINGTARNTAYGYSIWEMDVYGDLNPSCGGSCTSVDLIPNPVNPSNMLWAVAQAAPMRRVHVTDSVDLHRGYGWQSGGYIADSAVDGYLLMGSQQQWYTRNSNIAQAVEGTWNVTFQGTTGTKYQAAFPAGPLTDIANTPVIREKPFLYVNRDGKYNVFAPAIRTNAVGPSWTGTQTGTSIPLSSFYIAKSATDTATTLNNALASGKHLLITPGVYHLSAPLAVNNANTVVLGMGLATLVPDGGVNAINIADVDGVKVAGLLIDAGTVSSPVLVQVGPLGSSASHTSNPTSLHDIFARIGGGTWVGKATVSMQVNSKNAIIDHIWLWRADHSDTAGVVGWTINTAQNGLVVNGSDVSSYGAFVEHFQQYEVLWNGNNGKTYFLQNELPYDAPNQAAWKNGTSNGWASYKVADSVVSHQAYGMGLYAVFTMNACTLNSECATSICCSNGNTAAACLDANLLPLNDNHCTATTPMMQSDRAIEVNDAQPGVQLRNVCGLSLTKKGKIQNLLNTNGMTANAADFSTYPKLAAYH